MRARRGHTLLETVMSVSVFTVLAGLTFTIVEEAGGAVAEEMDASAARRDGGDLTALLGDELADANPATLAIDPQPELGDGLRFEVVVDDANGVVTWGARESGSASGVVHAGATIVWEVVETQGRGPALVRRVEAADGTPLGDDAVVVEGLAAPDAGGAKAFTATRSGNLVTIRMRLRAQSHEIVVRLRNP